MGKNVQLITQLGIFNKHRLRTGSDGRQIMRERVRLRFTDILSSRIEAKSIFWEFSELAEILEWNYQDWSFYVSSSVIP